MQRCVGYGRIEHFNADCNWAIFRNADLNNLFICALQHRPRSTKSTGRLARSVPFQDAELRKGFEEDLE